MDLQKWCGQGDVRYYLNQPFNFEGRTIATNGHLMIAIPKVGKYEEIYDGLIGKISELLKPNNFTFSAFDYDLKMPEKTACTFCKGTTKVTIENCQECDGDGEVEAETDFNTYVCDCKSCDGDGHTSIAGKGLDCHQCDAGSVYDDSASVKVCGVNINPNYYKLLSTIDGLAVHGSGYLLHFQAGETKGVIMGKNI